MHEILRKEYLNTSNLEILPLEIITEIALCKELRIISKYFYYLLNDTFYKKYSFDLEKVEFNHTQIKKLHNVHPEFYIQHFTSLDSIEYKLNILTFNKIYHILPNTVKRIKFTEDYQADLLINLLPSTIEYIHILGVQKKYKEWIIPENIKKIIIESGNNYSIQINCDPNIITWIPYITIFSTIQNMFMIESGFSTIRFS